MHSHLHLYYYMVAKSYRNQCMLTLASFPGYIAFRRIKPGNEAMLTLLSQLSHGNLQVVTDVVVIEKAS